MHYTLHEYVLLIPLSSQLHALGSMEQGVVGIFHEFVQFCISAAILKRGVSKHSAYHASFSLIIIITLVLG